jgi:putative protease
VKLSAAGEAGGKKGATQAYMPIRRGATDAANEPIRSQTASPELLAPCGSAESFFAAMESGADAVYAGLREFSARARAKNFTLGQMERMLSYAHQRNRRIYITLNTLIKQNELPQLVETLAELARLRVDGVIVQDMAVARLVKNHFPSIPLHASTQMTIHNLPGVQLLEELGFERVVLARELSLEAISAIAAKTPLELEIFVHGALCFCISGQCHFSSLLGGFSGNRGRCAQPCRRLYSQRSKDGYYFSPNDLSAIEMVPELVAAGVKSLKIEGRMKSADYVAKVVSAYRLMLDLPADRRKEALAGAKELLKDSFGRTPTKGFLASASPSDISNPWLRGGTGRFIGEVRKAGSGRLSFETRDRLHVGDRLRIQPKTDMAGQAWTMREIYQNRKKVTEAAPGSQVEVVCPFDAVAGDAVFKVASFDSFNLSDEAANRKLAASGPDRTSVRLTLGCRQEQPASTNSSWALDITAKLGVASFSYSFNLGELETARSTDMQAVLQSRFSETGETPFHLAELVADGFPALYIPPARLKEIRRELYQKLEQEGTGQQRKIIAEARQKALSSIESDCRQTKHVESRDELIITVDGPADVRWALSFGADRVIVQLSRATGHALARHAGRLKTDADRIVWQLPFQLFDRDIPYYLEMLQYLHGSGFRRFEATNPGHIRLLTKLEGISISAGYRLFSLNSTAIAQWKELGISQATLYLEDDLANLSDIINAGPAIPCSLLVYSPIDVMVTKVRLKDVATDQPLESDRGEQYHLSSRDGLSTISAATPFSLLGRLGELRRLGFRSFILDLSTTSSEMRQSVLAAFRNDQHLPDTSCFNFDRGLA